MQDLLIRYGINVSYNTLRNMWNRDDKTYHNTTHLFDLYSLIEDKYPVNCKEKEILLLVALFHDIIYIPGNFDNEIKSADFLLSACNVISIDIMTIYNIILETRTHQPTTELSEIFCDMDMDVLSRDYNTLICYERGIYQEYGKFNDYKNKRIDFIKSMLPKYQSNNHNLLKLIHYINISY